MYPKCKKSKNGRKRYCLACGKLMKRRYKETHPVEHKIRQCAENLVKRLHTNLDSPANKSYKEKGIKSLIGNTSSEVYEYLYNNHFEDYKYFIDRGQVPSIDRIDSDKHYEPGNIRIISFEENSRLGRESSLKVCSKPIRITYKDTGQLYIYGSVVEASKETEFTRDVLQNILKKRVKKNHGIIVEYINK